MLKPFLNKYNIIKQQLIFIMENDITYDNINSAWEEMQENLISVDEFSDVNRFFNACEAEFNEWLEWMAEYFYSIRKHRI